jgi:hypothetical protein
MTLSPFTPGPNLALAQNAVAERIADDPGTVDWFGLACAITDARVRDLKEQEQRR